MLQQTDCENIRLVLTSLGPMVLGAGFSGATTEDMRPTGSLSVSIESRSGVEVLLLVGGKNGGAAKQSAGKEPNRTELR